MVLDGRYVEVIRLKFDVKCLSLPSYVFRVFEAMAEDCGKKETLN